MSETTKEKTSFTPGPWVEQETKTASRHGFDPVVYEVTGDLVPSAIARVYLTDVTACGLVVHVQTDLSESAARANARLVSAAPDLYQACVACLDDYESELTGGRRSRRETIIEILRAALSKAEVSDA